MTRAEQLLAAIEQAEFPHVESLINIFVGGSELHGAKVKDPTTWTFMASIWNLRNLLLDWRGVTFSFGVRPEMSAETALTTLMSVCIPSVNGLG